MNIEPTMNASTAPAEPAHRWADDGGVLTEQPAEERDTPAGPPADEDEVLADEEDVPAEEPPEERDAPAEQQSPEPESTDPDTSFEVVGSGIPTATEAEALEDAGAVTRTSLEATSNPVVPEPLLTDEAEQAFLTRWAEIQVGFVEDPSASVRDADGLVGEIAGALLASFQARRTDLAADWQNGSPGTEELRLALRRYRAFIGVILPK